MRTLVVGIALSCLVFASYVAGAQEPGKDTPKEPARPAYAQDTPDAAFRSLLLAMAVGDEPALRRLVLPDDEFAFLLSGDHIPPDQVENFRKAVVEKVALTRLKAGDEVKLLGGRVLKIAPEEVSENRAVLLPQGPPLPLFAYRFKEGWMLDARPIIAGRKAADAARRAAEKKKGGN